MVRFLLGTAYAKLLLRGPAQEQLDLLPAEAQGDPGVQQVRQLLASLPDSSIGIDERARVCRRNLEALVGRTDNAEDLRRHLDAWLERTGAEDWFRTRDGNIVRRARADTSGWTTFVDARSVISAASLPHQDRKYANHGNFIRPMVVEGADPPWLLERVLKETPTSPIGYQPAIYLVQAEPLELLDGLAQTDLSLHLAEPRLTVLTGPDAGTRLGEILTMGPRRDSQLPGPVLNLSSVRTRATPPLDTILEAASTSQLHELTRLVAGVASREEERGSAYWSDRFAQAVAGTSPLRVLLATTRHSTFMHHAATDLAGGFIDAGHEAVVRLEPDAHSSPSALHFLRACEDLDPDLIVLINYTRSHFGKALPEGVPLVTWTQDAMQHLFRRATAEALGPRDFVAGVLGSTLVHRHGYPAERCLDFPIAASRRKFHSGPVDPALAALHTCDLAMVTHQSRTPEALHQQHLADARGQGALDSILEALFARIPTVACAKPGPIPSVASALRNLTLECVRTVAGTEPSSEQVDLLHTQYTLPIADRFLRHQTIAWAAEIALRRNWSFHLYGKGWETHPIFRRFAKGELPHGEALRASYHCASAHLQASVNSAVHQRVFECALAGGLPLIRLIADDLWTAEHNVSAIVARRSLALGTPPAACHRTRRGYKGNTRYLLPAEGCPEALAHLRFLDELAIERDVPGEDFVWACDEMLEKVRSGGLYLPPEERCLTWLLGNPTPALFLTPEQLEDRLERAITDPGARDRTSATLRARVGERLTHDAFVRRLVPFLADALRSPPAAR